MPEARFSRGMQSNDVIRRRQLPHSYAWFDEQKNNKHLSPEHRALFEEAEYRVRFLLRSEHARSALWELDALKRDRGVARINAVAQVCARLHWRVVQAAEQRERRRNVVSDHFELWDTAGADESPVDAKSSSEQQAQPKRE